MAELTQPQSMLVIVGARPQFIKAAALHRALKDRPEWEVRWLHTGQHHDGALSDQFFHELGLPVPHVRLHPDTSSREKRLGDMMDGIRADIEGHNPRWVMVFGDTDSTLAGAWAAAAVGVPIVHVEAGLRSHDWGMPEEVNRVLCDRMSSVLVCPTDAAVQHLGAEGIVDSPPIHRPSPVHPRVLRMGDVMHDNALHFGSTFRLDQASKGPVLLTMHRPSNVDDGPRLLSWLDAIGDWLESRQLGVIWPVHPRTAQALDLHRPDWRKELDNRGWKLEKPLGYLNLLKCIHVAPLVLTDSGGVQKESFSLGTRCVVLRDSTEWTEQVDRGQSILASGPTELKSLADEMLGKGGHVPDDLYGNGVAAVELVDALEHIAMRHG